MIAPTPHGIRTPNAASYQLSDAQCDKSGRSRRPHPLARFFRYGTPERPEDDLPYFGHRTDASESSLGALLQQGFDICFRAPKDLIIVAMKSYEGVMATNGDAQRRVRVQPGQILWRPAGSLVHAKTDGTAVEIAGVSTARHIREECAETMKLNGRLRSQLEGVSTMDGSSITLKAARRIRNAALAGFAIDRLAKDQLCIDLVRATLVAMSRDPDTDDRGAHLSKRQLTTAVDLIETHKTSDLTMKELASACGVTQPHLTVGFKAATGFTPYQYLIERRLAEARRILETSDAATADVAQDCGFSSQAHMTNLFSVKLGVTPARYRRIKGAKANSGAIN